MALGLTRIIQWKSIVKLSLAVLLILKIDNQVHIQGQCLLSLNSFVPDQWHVVASCTRTLQRPYFLQIPG